MLFNALVNSGRTPKFRIAKFGLDKLETSLYRKI